jgi:large subunit ribosomal protein L3
MSSQSKTNLPQIIGRKLGMAQVFRPDGTCIAVTVIEAGPNQVLGLKSSSDHGYEAVRVGFSPIPGKRLSQAVKGEFIKAETPSFRFVRELRCSADILGVASVGDTVELGSMFPAGTYVDVSGTSIGKGFSGVVKRFHSKGQPMSRGTHEYRRHIGAVGCRKFPGRIFKNKKMPGRMGGEKVTIQNLEVVDVHADKHILLVKGGIPGPKGSLVKVKVAIKRISKIGSGNGS